MPPIQGTDTNDPAPTGPGVNAITGGAESGGDPGTVGVVGAVTGAVKVEGNASPPKWKGKKTGHAVRKDGYVWEWDTRRQKWVALRKVRKRDRQRLPHASQGRDATKPGKTEAQPQPQQQPSGGGGGGRQPGTPSGGGGGGKGKAKGEEDARGWRERLRELYPQYAVFLQIPEVRKILEQATKEDWTTERLEGALQQTEWWDRTTQATRAWDYFEKTAGDTEVQKTIRARAFQLRQLAIKEFGAVELSTDDLLEIARKGMRWGWSDDQFLRAIRAHDDFVQRSEAEQQFMAEKFFAPEELKARIERHTAEIMDRAGALGVNVNGKQARELARTSVRFGWNDEQLRRNLVRSIDWSDPDALGGEAAQTWRNLQQIASGYLVKMSDNSRQKWAERIMRGDDTLHDFISYATGMAKSMFPSLIPVLDRGLTVEEYAEPYRELLANTLEMAPESINFMQNKFKKVLAGHTTQEGINAPMSLTAAEEYARSLPEWQFTRNAHEQYRTVAEDLAKMWGLVGVN